MSRGHDPGLNDIDGACCCGGSQTSQEGCGKVCCHIIAHGGVIHEQTLESIVGGKLARRHDSGATAIGQPASEPAQRTLLLGHADHAVDSMLVVPALVGRERGVVLHTHVDHIGEVTGNAAEETGTDGHGEERGEGWLLAARAGAHVTGLDLLIDAEPDSGIGKLAEQRGRYAAVESQGSVVFQDVDKCAAHVFRRIASACLKSNLTDMLDCASGRVDPLLRQEDSIIP